jgi:two-component system CheB/CheR fusion protein
VQDPEEAEYPSMPRSAIATGLADIVLPVRDLADQLVQMIRDNDQMWGGQVRDENEELVTRILAHVRVRTSHDFSNYKRSTVMRRISRRIQITRTSDLAHYYDYLREHAEEAQALLNDLLISVTTFFRDGEAFEAVAALIIPQLFQDKEAADTVRVWVPGCATGEEAYSLGMLLLEELSHRDVRPRIQVFGSDLDHAALATARDGRYPAAIEADVSEERLHRFFSREGDHYRVKRELREIVIFAFHSVLRDPPFSRMDVISCRNLLIYLDRGLQEQVLNTFHYALNPEGFLLLGTSETADNPPGLFRSIDRRNRIYQALASPGERPPLLPRLPGAFRVEEHFAHGARSAIPTASAGDAAAHRQALEKIAPPSILVDEAHRVVHLSDNAGRYLQPAGGPFTGDICRTGAGGVAVRFALCSAPCIRAGSTDAQRADSGALQWSAPPGVLSGQTDLSRARSASAPGLGHVPGRRSHRAAAARRGIAGRARDHRYGATAGAGIAGDAIPPSHDARGIRSRQRRTARRQ